MSRTYRKYREYLCTECLKPERPWKTPNKKIYCQCHEPDHWAYHAKYCVCRKDGRDNKPWYKPDANFKRIRQQRFRAQCRQVLYNYVYKGKDYIPPVNKKTDIWEWT